MEVIFSIISLNLILIKKEKQYSYLKVTLILQTRRIYSFVNTIAWQIKEQTYYSFIFQNSAKEFFFYFYAKMNENKFFILVAVLHKLTLKISSKIPRQDGSLRNRLQQFLRYENHLTVMD